MADGKQDGHDRVPLDVTLLGTYWADPDQYGTDDPTEIIEIVRQQLRDGSFGPKELLGELADLDWEVQPAESARRPPAS